ncbi:site-specific integrase [Corynebacterium sp. CNJ-954]|uniref:tyrosine-type recombinase/integrase n=1 Tax=Corynebacterium sp. CNJ-954 TaxID=1904962 RepID=UPI0013010C65|nr:site-specific integrase [Corynebacterium sp. CNJ-954]
MLSTSLADEPVVQVSRSRITEWWAEVQERWPDTAPTNSYAYKRLRTCFQFAVDAEIIGVNPVNVKGAGVPPRPKTRDHDLITLQQARAMADGVNERFKAPVEVLLWCGLRIGELLELRRKDVRGLSEDGTLTLRIRRNVQRMKDMETGKQVMVPFGTPKTDAANRDVVVPSAVAANLREHCRKHVAPGAESLIVTTEKGKRIMDTTFRSALKRGTRVAGREDVTPHDCRRFYATTMVSNGVNVEDVRRLMGHETVDQVMEYMRSASGYEKDAAEVLSRVMNSVAPSATGDQDDQDDQDGDDE